MALGLGVLLAVLLAEVVLRLAGIGAPQFHAYDAEHGVRHRPGAEGLCRGDGQAWVSINSAGLHSPERPAATPHEGLNHVFMAQPRGPPAAPAGG